MSRYVSLYVHAHVQRCQDESIMGPIKFNVLVGKHFDLHSVTDNSLQQPQPVVLWGHIDVT